MLFQWRAFLFQICTVSFISCITPFHLKGNVCLHTPLFFSCRWMVEDWRRFIWRAFKRWQLFLQATFMKSVRSLSLCSVMIIFYPAVVILGFFKVVIPKRNHAFLLFVYWGTQHLNVLFLQERISTEVFWWMVLLINLRMGISFVIVYSTPSKHHCHLLHA